jgi:flagellar operon protein
MVASSIYPVAPPCRAHPALGPQCRAHPALGPQTVDPTAFRRELDSRIRPEGLTFSRHAQKRLEMRGISLTPQGMQRIEQAVSKAEEKGSRDALVVAGGLSLVVSVTNRTVVTVMTQENMDESVITNIDSAVFA